MSDIKSVKVDIPEGYEIDESKSTFTHIVFKKKERKVKVWTDLKEIDGYYITAGSKIASLGINSSNNNHKNIALTEKHCKMMLAIAQISQLIPYYGGVVSNECDQRYSINYDVKDRKLSVERMIVSYTFLTFHTKAQAQEFLKHNERLVRDFYMLD